MSVFWNVVIRRRSSKWYCRYEYYCRVCNRTIPYKANMIQHLRGRAHKKAVEASDKYLLRESMM